MRCFIVAGSELDEKWVPSAFSSSGLIDRCPATSVKPLRTDVDYIRTLNAVR